MLGFIAWIWGSYPQHQVPRPPELLWSGYALPSFHILVPSREPSEPDQLRRARLFPTGQTRGE